MITTFYPPFSFGGDGIFVHRLSNALARRGHSVEVIHCLDSYRALARNKSEASYENESNVIMHPLASKAGVLSPLATQQTGRPFFKSAAIRRILSNRFDVIHYHNISLVGGPGILHFGEAIKLYTMHEYWLVCPTHVLFKFNQEACTSRQCVRCSLFYKRPPQWWRYTGLLDRAVKEVDAFIAPSRFASKTYSSLGQNLPIEHLPPFVPRFEPTGSAVRQPDFGPYFLFVGRLEKLKGLQTLIPVFQRYRKASLIVAGTGGYESELKRQAESCPNIHFTGFVSKDELQSLYRNAVALIVPSICYEVFPLTIIEAFAEEVPAIARRIGALPEIIEESDAGFIYDSEKELTEAMDRLVDDPALRRRLGGQGRQAYLTKWTPEVHVDRYIDLVRGIAARRTAPL